MSSVGSSIGGKSGGGLNVDQTQYPYFTSPGGVTPQQTALGSYDYGQNLLEGEAQFEGTGAGGGPIDSTMATQTAGGARLGEAINPASAGGLVGMSDVNQGAMYDAYGNAINIDQQNNQNALAQNEQNLQTGLQTQTTLNQLAGSALGGQAAANTPVTGSAQ